MPTPNTAMLAPACGCSALSTAPAPVWIPQPNGATKSSGTSGSSRTDVSLGRDRMRWRSSTGRRSANGLAPAYSTGGRPVGAGGAEVPAPEVVADPRAAGGACRAGAAGAVAERDVVAGRHLGDRCADGLDDARSLVPEHRRQRHRVPLVTDDQVGVTDPAGDDPHHDLVGTRLVELELLDRERGALGLGDRGPRCASLQRLTASRVSRAPSRSSGTIPSRSARARIDGRP